MSSTLPTILATSLLTICNRDTFFFLQLKYFFFIYNCILRILESHHITASEYQDKSILDILKLIRMVLLLYLLFPGCWVSVESTLHCTHFILSRQMHHSHQLTFLSTHQNLEMLVSGLMDQVEKFKCSIFEFAVIHW